jgi:hypothetical protein
MGEGVLTNINTKTPVFTGGLLCTERQKSPAYAKDFVVVGRDDWIRTSGLLHPMQTRYRAALRPEFPQGEANLR